METGPAPRVGKRNPEEVANEVMDTGSLRRTPLGATFPVPSESHSEVHCECDGVGCGRAYRLTESDWQVCLDEISFEQAVVMLNGPAFINQGRKSHCGVIYYERRS
jgi:hypothetical protein